MLCLRKSAPDLPYGQKREIFKLPLTISLTQRDSCKLLRMFAVLIFGVCGAGSSSWIVLGRYDILVLPPSFPYGGMENPQLTFVTPSLLSGDKSNAGVVAHEIAHSWTGNLVTNVTWEHFWLNEGFTMFVERKILAGVRVSLYANSYVYRFTVARRPIWEWSLDTIAWRRTLNSSWKSLLISPNSFPIWKVP